MIRKLEILMLTAIGAAALGTASPSGAEAAEFHCSVAPCTYTLEPDGAVGSKPAHHVFVIKNKLGEATSITCTQVTGYATSITKTTPTLRFANIQYQGCTSSGSAMTIKMNGCEYEFNATGNMSIVGCAGKSIELLNAVCVATIGEQLNLGKVTYTNLGTAPTRTFTVAINLTGLKVSAFGKPANDSESAGFACGLANGSTNGPYTGEYTTGNTVIKAETDTETPTHVDGWWE